MTEQSKTVIIGLDGVPFDMLKTFAEDGTMPNTAQLISQGIFKKMNSSIPEVSSAAWSSIITGSNPGTHGIFGFTDLRPKTYKICFPNFTSLKAPAFWQQSESQSVIINVPSTYPVRQMNGVHISGFVSIDFEKSVYPPSLLPRLKDMDYRLDVDSQKAHRSIELFLDDVDETLNARIEAYKYLWERYDWQIFMLVFTGTDRLMHFLWSAYEDRNHQFHSFFLDHFRKIDKTIGEIASRISNDDLLVPLSDHGFERLDHDIYINYFLADQGFLKFKPGADLSLEAIDHGTKAFALDPARIYINYKDKYPCGTVAISETEDVLSQLEDSFGSLKIDGKNVIRDTYRKQQLYTGPCTDNAPDMVLVGAEGFNLKSHIRAANLTDKGIFTGKHTQDTAFLLIKGLTDETIVPATPAVWDVKGIIEKQT